MTTLKECCSLLADGDWIESKDQSNDGIRLIQTGNIGNGEYLEKESRAKYITENTFKNLGCTEVFSGDILVSRLPDPVGRACKIPSKTERMITAVDCSILRVDKTVVDSDYLLLFLQSPQYFYQLTGKLAGTTRIRVSRKNLEKVTLDIPQKGVQAKVVNTLNHIQSIIRIRKQQLADYDTLIKARFVEMFGDETNPYNWPIINVEDIATVTVGVVIKPAQYYTDADHGVKAFRSLNIGEMYIKDNDWVYFTQEGNDKNNKSQLHENDLLIIRSGAPGVACIVTKQYEGCNAIDIIIARPNTDKIDPYYLCMYTNMPHGKRQIEEGTGGAAQQHFNVGKYNKLRLMLPPIEKQKQFSDFIAQIDKSKLSIQQGLKKLEILKKALMQQYFG